MRRLSKPSLLKSYMAAPPSVDVLYLEGSPGRHNQLKALRSLVPPTLHTIYRHVGCASAKASATQQRCDPALGRSFFREELLFDQVEVRHTNHRAQIARLHKAQHFREAVASAVCIAVGPPPM